MTIRSALLFAIAICHSFLSQAVAAGVLAKVHLSEQNFHVFIDGKQRYVWPISSGREGFETPTGEFQPERVYERYFSRQYNYAPMPHSVFFFRGYAIHGTTMVARLGRRASRGCIRLHPEAARTFFGLVRRYGLNQTKIVIVDRSQ